ncbi:hypothetical protein GOODEAATRI_009565, partial [Goodea atripinnis]
FDLLDFSDQMALLSVSSLEVMFLLSAQQFSNNPASPTPDRASLQAVSCVEKMQELILDLLSRVCGAQAGAAARGGPQRFGHLLGRLTELRTLHHNYLLLTGQQPAN